MAKFQCIGSYNLGLCRIFEKTSVTRSRTQGSSIYIIYVTGALLCLICTDTPFGSFISVEYDFYTFIRRFRFETLNESLGSAVTAVIVHKLHI
jgi:hypothetical protein